MEGIAVAMSAGCGLAMSAWESEKKEFPTVIGVLTPPVVDLPCGTQPLTELFAMDHATGNCAPVPSLCGQSAKVSLEQPSDPKAGCIATPESQSSTSPDLPVNVPKPDNPSLVKPRPTKGARERWFERRSWPHVCGLSDRFSIQGQVGQGTFGSVLKAIDRIDKETVAIKKFQYDRDEGVPITAIREMKLLQRLNHPNVIKPKTICMDNVDHTGMEPTGEISMVFPFMHYDLAGMMDEFRPNARSFTPEQKKSLAKQIISGVHYLHKNHVIHRDLKGANVLLSNKGEIKLADFGLSRPYNPKIHGRMTSTVVTRWYRPPELVLNDREYNEKVDMWGVGCMLAELHTGQVLFPGESDEGQLNAIIRLCGQMNYENFPRLYQLPERSRLNGITGSPIRTLKQYLQRFISDMFLIDLIDRLLTYDPKKRLSAAEALDHKYFWCDPYPCPAEATIPIHLKNSEVHEMSRKKRKIEEDARNRPQQPRPQDQHHRSLAGPSHGSHMHGNHQSHGVRHGHYDPYARPGPQHQQRYSRPAQSQVPSHYSNAQRPPVAMNRPAQSNPVKTGLMEDNFYGPSQFYM